MSFRRVQEIVAGVRFLPLSVLAATLLLCGCPSAPSATKSKPDDHPYSKQEVELVVPKSLQLPSVWEVILQEWMSQTGATIRWNEYSTTDEFQNAVQTAPTATGGRVVLFSMPDFYGLEDLAKVDTGSVVGFDSKDIFRGLRDRILSRNRSLVAIPISAPVLVCYYRADLLKAAKLKPPETWEDYQALVNSLDQWAPQLTAVEPLGPEHRSTLFLARTLSAAKHPESISAWFDLESGKPVVDTTGIKESAEIAQQTWAKMPVAIAEFTPLQCRREVTEGRAALAIGVEPVVASKSSELNRTSGIEIGVCRLPGSRRVFNRDANRWESLPAGSIHAPTLCAFDGLAIGVQRDSTDKKDMGVWHLLSTLTIDQFESAWSTLPKTLCRESQVGSAGSWNDSGLTLEESSHYIDSVAQSLRGTQLVPEVPIREATLFRSAVSTCVGKILNKEQPASEAIHQLQQDFEQIVSKIGADKLRLDYRRGLGLPNLDRSASSTPSPQ